MPGPPPTPTAILIARDSRLVRTREHEPKSAVAMPRMPIGLNGVKKQLWRAYGKSLTDMGVITDNDGPALMLLVSAHHDFLSLESAVEQHGHMVRGRMGEMVKNPEVAMRNNAFKAFLKVLQEFGLSPASRARVQSMPPQSDDADDRYGF